MKVKELMKTCRGDGLFEIRVNNYITKVISKNHLKTNIPLMDKEVIDWGYSRTANMPFINIRGDVI